MRKQIIIIAILSLSVMRLDAQSSGSAGGFEDTYYGQLDALYKNPSLKLFLKMPRELQLQMIRQAEVLKLKNDPYLMDGAYEKAALKVYGEAVATLSPEERRDVDQMVLRSVWTDSKVSDAEIQKIAARVFAQSPSGGSVGKIEDAACELAQYTASVSTAVNTATDYAQQNSIGYGESLASVAAVEAGTRRFASLLTPEKLGAARHVICPGGQYVGVAIANKSLAELQNISVRSLQEFRSANARLAGPSRTSNFAPPGAPQTKTGPCTLTQIHDALVDGERVLRTNPGTRYMTITNSNGCAISGDLTRDSKTGTLKIQIRPYAPGAPSTYQEGKDLSTLVKKIFEWQEVQTAAARGTAQPSAPTSTSAPAPVAPASATRR